MRDGRNGNSTISLPSNPQLLHLNLCFYVLTLLKCSLEFN